MVICPICGKEESVAILGYIKGDKEADFNAVFDKH